MRARLRATRDGGGEAEILLCVPPATCASIWPRASGWRWCGPGASFAPAHASSPAAPARRSSRCCRTGRAWCASMTTSDVATLLERHGEVPLPPYVVPRGAWAADADAARAQRYQRCSRAFPGSVAAPTASLHFTDAILSESAHATSRSRPLVLDVGIATFPADERCDDRRPTSCTPSATRSRRRRLLRSRPHGATAGGSSPPARRLLRALESAALHDGIVREGEAQTRCS